MLKKVMVMGETIVAVVPAFNEETTIGAVVRDLMNQSVVPVVVDDGSFDRTYERSVDAGAVTVRHVLNMGQGAALLTGIVKALTLDPGIIVTFDADGQYQGSDLAALTSPIVSKKFDVALGSRFLNKDNPMPFSRKFLLKLAIFYTRATTGLKVTDTHNGLRAFSRKVAEDLKLTQPRMAHASEILHEIANHKWSYVEVPVSVLYTPYSRNKGQSGWQSFRILFDLWFRR